MTPAFAESVNVAQGSAGPPAELAVASAVLATPACFTYAPLCRAFYVTFRGLGKGYDAQLARLTAIGAKLRRALERAQKGGPGTWNHKTAWLLAEEATQELGQVVDVYLPAKALITASGERLLKKR